MYKIYITRKTESGSEIDPASRTATSSPKIAEAAFRELLSRDDLNGQCTALVLSLNNKLLMYHRFDHKPGMEGYVSKEDQIRIYDDE